MTSFFFSYLLSLGVSALLFLMMMVAEKRELIITSYSGVWLVCIAASIMPFLPIVNFLPELSNSASHFVWLSEQQTHLSEYYLQAQTLLTPTIEKAPSHYAIALICLTLILCSGINVCRFAYTAVKLHLFIARLKSLPVESALFKPHQDMLKTRNIRIKLTKQKTAPFVCGVWHPIIVIPEFLDSLPPMQQQAIIEHELMHIKRNDHRITWAVMCVSALFCINPFIRRFANNYIVAMEFNCDADVLQNTNTCKKEYAASFLACLKLGKPTFSGLGVAGFGDQHKKSNNSKSTVNKARLQLILAGKNKQTAVAQYIFIFTVLCVSILTNIAFASLDSTKSNNSDWLAPLAQYKITSTFGVSHVSTAHIKHAGIDLLAPHGTNVTAANAGTIVLADSTTLNSSYGKVVIIEHSNGYSSMYAHLSAISVAVGDSIKLGESLGEVGSSGASRRSHLHFELRKDGMPTDPTTLIEFHQHAD